MPLGGYRGALGGYRGAERAESAVKKQNGFHGLESSLYLFL